MKKKLPLALLLICLVTSLFNDKAFAGGWPVKKGKFLLSISASYFKSTSRWDSVGKLGDYEQNGYFSSVGFATYMEYGISRRVTGVASLPFAVNEFSQLNGAAPITISGFGDAELGLRYYFANIDFKYYFGIQATAVLPLYSNVAIGFKRPGAEIKLVGSTAGRIGSKKIYLNAELGGRQYFADAGPFQFKYSGSFGYNFDAHNQLTAGVNGVYSVSTDKTFNPNLVVIRDFSYTGVSLNYGHIFSPTFSMFAGVNQFLVGRSTGKGTNFSLSVITKF